MNSGSRAGQWECKCTIRSPIRFWIFIIVITSISIVLLLSLFHFSSKFEVDSASFESFKFNGSMLTAELNITLTISNINFLHSVSYDAISVGINYSDGYSKDFLATSVITPFSQGITNKVTRGVHFNNCVDNHVPAEIVVSYSQGKVNFQVALSTSIKFHGVLRFRKALKVVCDPLSFVHSPETSNWALLRGLTCQ